MYPKIQNTKYHREIILDRFTRESLLRKRPQGIFFICFIQLYLRQRKSLSRLVSGRSQFKLNFQRFI